MRLSPTDALTVATFVFHEAANELSPATEMHFAIYHLRALAVLLNAHLPHIRSVRHMQHTKHRPIHIIVV
jgi:hypothetical protein